VDTRRRRTDDEKKKQVNETHQADTINVAVDEIVIMKHSGN
jgi:hypothetical protein